MVGRSPKIINHPEEWNLWKVADALEKKAMDKSFYPELTKRVVHILRLELSQYVGRPEWRSLLDQRTLQYALEESIVAIALYEESMATLQYCNRKHIAVDVCAGKGLYSLLLSYCRPSNLESIVMIENAAIHWHHIHGANNTMLEEKYGRRPHIDIWEKMNLHEHDTVVSRLLELPYPLVLTGIHLCQQLSPAFCGLVNTLESKCLMSCLVPCCLPRVANIPITVPKYQEAEDKPETTVSLSSEFNDTSTYRIRQKHVQKGQKSNQLFHQRSISAWCFLCHDPRHLVQGCSLLQQLPEHEQIQILQAARVASISRQNNLENYECYCPTVVVRAGPKDKICPLWTLDLSTIFQETTGSETDNWNRHGPKTNPYEGYCRLLSTSLQDRSFVKVIEAPLDGSSVHHPKEYGLHRNRKKLFIVAGGYKIKRSGGR
jgi:hypothetical protein